VLILVSTFRRSVAWGDINIHSINVIVIIFRNILHNSVSRLFITIVDELQKNCIICTYFTEWKSLIYATLSDTTKLRLKELSQLLTSYKWMVELYAHKFHWMEGLAHYKVFLYDIEIARNFMIELYGAKLVLNFHINTLVLVKVFRSHTLRY